MDFVRMVITRNFSLVKWCGFIFIGYMLKMLVYLMKSWLDIQSGIFVPSLISDFSHHQKYLVSFKLFKKVTKIDFLYLNFLLLKKPQI